MKHILSLIGILLYFLTVLFTACTWEPDSYSRTPDHLLDRRLTLEQARLIFEQENELLSPRPIT